MANNGGVVSAKLDLATKDFTNKFDSAVKYILSKSQSLKNIKMNVSVNINGAQQGMKAAEKTVRTSVNTMNNLLHSVGMAVVHPKVSSNIDKEIEKQVARAKYSLSTLNFTFNGPSIRKEGLSVMPNMESNRYATPGSQFGMTGTKMWDASRMTSYINGLKNLNKEIEKNDKSWKSAKSSGFAATGNFPLEYLNRFNKGLDISDKEMAKYTKQAKEAAGSTAAMGRSFAPVLNGYNQLKTNIRDIPNQLKAIQTAQSSFASSGFSNISRYNSVLGRIGGIASTSAMLARTSLSSLNNVTFGGMVNKFKGAMDTMVQGARAGASSIRNRIVDGLSATDYMATIFAGMIGSTVWNKAYGKSTMKAQLGNKYDDKTAAQFQSQYQAYTVKSSTSDEQINNIMRFVTQSGIESSKTESALSAVDAAATSSDPTQRYELLRNFSNYLTSGYTEAMFRGDVTQEEADLLKGANSPEERVAAMNQLAQGRGNLDEFGNNLSTTTTGQLGAFNAALITLDNIMRGLTLAFTDFMVWIRPLFDWFNNLGSGTQNLLAKMMLLVGGITMLISVAGILFQLMSPLGALFWAMVRPLVINAIGLNTNAVAMYGYIASLRMATYNIIANALAIDFKTVALNGAVATLVAKVTMTDADTIAERANTVSKQGALVSLYAYIISQDVATISKFGYITATIATITSTNAETVANWGLVTSIRAVTMAMLTNPYFLLAAAIIGIVVIIYEVGRAFGWWNSIMDAGKAVWAGLQRLWSAFINNPMMINFINQIKISWMALLYAISPITNAFGMLWNALFPKTGSAGNYDFVASIINFFGQLGSTTAWLFGVIQGNPILNTLVTALLFVINPVYAVIYAFEQLGQFFGLWGSWGEMFQVVGSAIYNTLNWIGGAIGNTFGFIMNSFFKDGEWQGILGGVWNMLNGVADAILSFFQTTDWGAVWTYLVNGLTGIGDKIKGAIFGTGGPGLGEQILNWVNSVDWVGIINWIGRSLMAVVANNNPITLILRLLFGDAVGNSVAKGLYDTVVGAFGTMIAVMQTTWNIVSGIAMGIYNALKPIICVLIGCSPGIVPALQTMYNAFVSILGAVWSVVSPFVNVLVRGFTFIINVARAVGSVLGTAFGQLLSGDIGGAFSTLFSGLGSIGSTVISMLLSVDWGGMLLSAFTTIASIAAQYNPIAIIVGAIFGDAAGTQVSATIFNILMWIGTTFITGLQTIWTYLMSAVVFIQSVWTIISSNAMIAWGLIQMYIVNPVRNVWNTIMFVFNAVKAYLGGVWNGIRTNAINTFNAIKNAIMNPFNTVKSLLTNVWNGLKSGWNLLVAGFKSGADRLKSAVMGPVKTVYNALVDLWNLVTGGKVGKMAGEAGPKPTKKGVAGPSPRRSSGGMFAGPSNKKSSSGLFGSIYDNVAGFVNRTANNNGLPGRYAGTIGSGSKKPDDCSPENPCYAGGWGDLDYIKNKAMGAISSWPLKMKIPGLDVTQGIINDLKDGKMGLTTFEAIAKSIIGKTSYKYYYDGQQSDAEVIASGRCNCFDGAELLINLASRMGLPASMGHGTWGSDGHAWAVVAGKVFDTTAFQKGYGWKAPKVKGYSAGPRPATVSESGSNTKEDNRPIIQLNFKGANIYANDLKEIIRSVMDEYTPSEGGF